ncbi:prephenate dehydratase domain-containing protein [Nocardia sp. CA-107356]|uniref:prephenate dehydratase domain-containing protein n=1 Tax=Nocardia sp. CA-107356 TaxID=3239972 RepID=UPI003D9142AB
MTLLSFMTLGPSRTDSAVVGTLGPAGTSSELAATELAGRFTESVPDPSGVRLFDTYEAAGDALRANQVTHVVVANAYKAVHRFYMDPTLELTDVFVMDTPQYGIAARPGTEPRTESPTIMTHPSPVQLIEQLLPQSITSHEVILTNSTSAAALAVSEGTADLALTTAPAVGLYGLEFISKTRPIRMVWSVFGRRSDRVE